MYSGKLILKTYSIKHILENIIYIVEVCFKNPVYTF